MPFLKAKFGMGTNQFPRHITLLFILLGPSGKIFHPTTYVGSPKNLFDINFEYV
jgi:hypothetical protein